MIIQKEIRNLINEIAKDNNISFNTAREIIYSQFKYVKQEMESGVKDEADTFKSVQLRFLGTFFFSKKKINFFKNKNIKNMLDGEE